MPFDELSKRHLEQMVVSMREAGLAHNSIATYLRVFNTFLRWCQREGLCEITIPNLKEKDTVKETYTDSGSEGQMRNWSRKKSPAWGKTAGDFCNCRFINKRDLENSIIRIAKPLARVVQTGGIHFVKSIGFSFPVRINRLHRRDLPRPYQRLRK